MRVVLAAAFCLAAGFVGLMAQARPGTLTIYYIDTEGGQSTRVDAVGADGQPVRTPEAVELLGLLRDRIG